MKTIATEAGEAIITHRDLATLTDGKWGTNGSIALGILGPGDPHACWCLFWEWGGDWGTFEDGQELDPEQLNGWEPSKVREAVAEAITVCPDCEEDMEWFERWADVAEATLSGKED